MPDDFLARRPLAAACALSAVLWAAFFLWLEPYYATNDDPLIAMLPAGAGFAVAPDEHLVFTNVLVGLALRGLHSAVPGWPWYGLYLLAALVLAQTALLHAALRANPRWPTVALFAAYFAVAAVPFANNLQFTVTAFVATQAGLLLAFGRPEGRGRLAALCALGLAVLGALIRFEAFALALALAAPAALVALWRADRAVRRRAAGVMAAGLGLALGARAFDAAYYQRADDWAAYREFNRTLAQFVDFERANEYTPQTASAFRAVGWSRNDHRLLLHWFHPDREVFSTQNLRAVLAQVPSPASSAWDRLGEGLGRMLRNRPARPILLALPLALLACGTARQSRLAVLAGLAASAAVLAYLIVFRKAPPHVYLPVLAFPLALALVLPAARPSAVPARMALWLAIVLAGAGGVRALALQRAESVEGQAREVTYARGLEPLRDAQERLVVMWSTFPYHVAGPFSAPGTVLPAHFVALGWPQGTPAAALTLARFGHSDLIAALGDARTRLVAPAEAGAWVEQYAQRHRGLALQLVPEATVPGLTVFRGVVSAAGEAADRVLRSQPAAPE
jgi:hypothetical protein